MNKKLIFSLIGITVVSVSIFSVFYVFYEYCTMVTPSRQDYTTNNPYEDDMRSQIPPDYKHCTSIWKDITQQSDKVTIEECTKGYDSYIWDAFLNNTHTVTVYTEQNKTGVPHLAHLEILGYYYEVDYGTMSYVSYLQQNCPLYQN